MDCKEFREVLDLYVDSELSTEAMATAGVHASECTSCRLAAGELFRLRRLIQEAVNRHQPPPGLVESVQRSLSPAVRRSGVPVLVAVLLMLLAAAVLGSTPWGRASLAGGMEQIAFQLDEPREISWEGVVVCRECELYSLYGGPKERDRQGHHGALKTAGGKIWNFMEGDKTYALIHDESLIGKRLRIRAKVYRRAGCVEVESYEILPSI